MKIQLAPPPSHGSPAAASNFSAPAACPLRRPDDLAGRGQPLPITVWQFQYWTKTITRKP